uniref:Deoxyribonuclease ycfH n=1 Tax=Arundo donax TaxID=35708 RepID=A0A0A9CG57_ARUDO
MAQGPVRAAVLLFDAHCHLQDPRVASDAPALIRAAAASGVARFAVNGTFEKDWQLVKQMAENNPAVVPSFGLRPWWAPKGRRTGWIHSGGSSLRPQRRLLGRLVWTKVHKEKLSALENRLKCSSDNSNLLRNWIDLFLFIVCGPLVIFWKY